MRRNKLVPRQKQTKDNKSKIRKRDHDQKKSFWASKVRKNHSMPKVTFNYELSYDEMIEFLKWDFKVQTQFFYNAFSKKLTEKFLKNNNIPIEAYTQQAVRKMEEYTHGLNKYAIPLYPKISNKGASNSSPSYLHPLDQEKKVLLSNKNLPQKFKEQLLKIELKPSQDISALDNLIEEINFEHALYFKKKPFVGLPLSLVDCIRSKEKISSFSFSEYGLTRLPEKLIDLLSQMPYLNELFFNNNYIHTIPPSINKLKALRSLYLNKNNIYELPFTLSDLDLEFLALSDNKLKAIPDFFKKFKNLAELYLSSNQIPEINNVIFYLRKLRKFHIAFNQIEMISEDIGNLIHLESLHVGGNRLRSLPEAISRLPIDLPYHLSIEGNPFISLPRALRKQLIETNNHEFLPLLELHPDLQLEVTLKAPLHLQIEDLASSFSSSVSFSKEGKDGKTERLRQAPALAFVAKKPMIFSSSMHEQRKKPLSRAHFLLALGIGVAAVGAGVACYKRFSEP